MCGMVGMMGHPSGTQDKIFEFLLQIDVIRGKDSTGIAAIMKNKVSTLKGACLPQILMYDKTYKELISRQNFCLMGHNRWKTQGDVKAANAHPFTHGDITMAHNGTLVGTWDLPGHNKFETDSETICHSINEIGIEETWKLVHGAAALVWWDNKDKTLNFLRNEERPLWFSYLAKDKGLIWASESWMIDAVFDIFDVQRHVDPDGADCWYPKPNDHFKFKWNGNKVETTSRTLEPRKKTIVVKDTRAGTGAKGVNNNVLAMFPGLSGGGAKGGIAPWAEADDQLLEWYCSSDSRKKTISEEEYRKNFHVCAGCEEDINTSFSTVVIVDIKSPKAFCDDCAQTAALSGIDLETADFK